MNEVNSIWTAVVMEYIVGNNLDDLLVLGEWKPTSNANVINDLKKILGVLKQPSRLNFNCLRIRFAFVGCLSR